MPHRKISALASAASAQAAQVFPLVSAGANKQITQRTLFQNGAFYQEATALATATVAFLPTSGIMDLYAKVIVNGSATDGGMVVNVGVGADATYFGTITVSARGIYRLTNVSARNLANASGAVVAAAPGASAASNVVVGVGYVRL
jgi:hypothetical protein